MTPRLALCIGLALATAATAQAPFVPPDSLIVVQMDGPAKIGADFAETNLSRMLASPKVRSLTGMLEGLVQMGVRSAGRETEADVEGLVDGLLGYRGRMTLAFNLLTEDPDFRDPPPAGGVLVLDADGETDLPALAKALATLLEERAGSLLGDLEIDGRTMRTVGRGGAGMTVPQIVDGRLVTFFGMPLADTVALYTGHRNAQGAGHDGSIAVHVNGTRLMNLVRAGIRNADDDEEEADMVLAMIDVFGAGNLAAVDLRFAAEGKHVVADGALAFDGAIRGYFGFFVPDAAGRPAVLARAPTDRDVWSVQTMRTDKMLPWLKELFEVMGQQAPTTYEEMRAAFQQQFDLDLEADLGRHLGDRMILAGDAAMLPGMLNDEDAPDHLCLALTVRDGAALQKTLRTMLEKSGMPMQSEAHGNVDVHRLPAPDALIEWAVADDLLLLGMGPAGGVLLRRLIDGAETELPAAIAQRLMLAPEGWDSASSVRLAPFIDGMLAAVKEQRDVPQAVERYTQLFVGLLADFDLEYLVSGTRSGSGRIVQRTIW